MNNNIKIYVLMVTASDIDFVADKDHKKLVKV